MNTTSKNFDEQIAELDKKIEQFKAQRKAIIQQEKQAKLKAKNKRIMEIGTIIEEEVGVIHDMEAFRNYVKQYSYNIQKTQMDILDAYVNENNYNG